MKWKTILTFIVLYEMLLYGAPFLDMYISTISAYLIVGILIVAIVYGLEKISLFNKKVPRALGIIILVLIVIIGLFV
ncbi:hypothetical protein [Oceanobacillus manasiensis]|uniref:hypothetical protein n=1 Tax=Oceanobacillus manasiensis TaxID=586413 RepID=UPI0005A9964E|nr:hypothetical protein [Oceanobacillus manasiensis]